MNWLIAWSINIINYEKFAKLDTFRVFVLSDQQSIPKKLLINNDTKQRRAANPHI